MVKIDFDISGNKISYIKITGDFFLFPETAINDIEKLFKGMHMPLDKDFIIDNFKNIDAQLIGVKIEEIISAIMENK